MNRKSNPQQISAVADDADLVAILKELLAGTGLRKQGKNWRGEIGDASVIVNLQKFPWGAPRYYLNLGVFPKAMNPPPSFLEYQCPLRARIEDLAQDHMRARALFELDDYSISPEQRASEIRDAIDRLAIPFLKQCSTLPGIRSFLRENKRVRSGTAVAFLEFLGITNSR